MESERFFPRSRAWLGKADEASKLSLGGWFIPKLHLRTRAELRLVIRRFLGGGADDSLPIVILGKVDVEQKQRDCKENIEF
jgi:hypothetical protein